jgi:hypothetical protein
MKKLLTILIVLSIWATGMANADDCTFDVRLFNNSDKQVNYDFRWVDHPYFSSFSRSIGPNWVNSAKTFKTWPVAGGELDPSETLDLTDPQKCGTYYVKWTMGDTTWISAFTESGGSVTLILMPEDGI